MAYIFGSIWDRFNRNALNDLSRSVEQQGKSIQDLVAEGQLTPDQYAELIKSVNGLLSSGEVTIHDIDKNKGKIDQTFLSQELIDAITGSPGANVLSTVADESVTSESLAEGAVVPEKTNFFNINQTRNLLDPTQVTMNKTIDTSGNIIDDDSRWLSDFIPLRGYKNVSITSASYRVALYLPGKVFVTRTGITNESLIDLTTRENDYAFIRISGTRNVETTMVNYGTTLYNFESGIRNPKIKKEVLHELEKDDIKDGFISPEKTDFIRIEGSNQLFNEDTVTHNTSMTLSGDLEETSTWWLSDFIPFTRDNFKLAANTNGSNVRLMVYSTEKTFNFRTGFESSYEFAPHIIPGENETRFFRVSGTYSSHPPSTFMLNYGDAVLPHDDFEPPKLSLDPDLIKYPDRGILKRHLSDELVVEMSKSRAEQPFPKKINFEEISSGWSEIKHLSNDGEVLYFSRGRVVEQSLDEGETIDRILAMPSEIPSVQAIRELEDGELLISTTRDESIGLKSKVFKTIGYDRMNPTDTTLKEVLEAISSQANIYAPWGLEAHDNICLASEYGLRGDDGARHVYLSTDYGETWEMIFDQKTTTQNIEGAPVWTSSAHLHTVHYDRYWERIWLVVGDNPNTSTYYSDDLGDSWKHVPGSEIVQYTGIISFPDGVVFGSDRAPNGLHVWKRTLNKSDPVKIEVLKKINDENVITHVFQRPFRRYSHKGEMVLFPATRVSAFSGVYSSVLMAFTNIDNPYQIYELPYDVTGMIEAVGPTKNGYILTTTPKPGVDGRVLLRGKAPLFE